VSLPNTAGDLADIRHPQESHSGSLCHPNRFPYANSLTELLEFVGRLQVLSSKPVGIKIVVSGLKDIEELISAIRNADGLDELQRMVGPTEIKNAMARRRLGMIEAIWEKAGSFENMELHQRDRYDSLMADQTEFENKYC
jgi:hypothetical protein